MSKIWLIIIYTDKYIELYYQFSNQVIQTIKVTLEHVI